MTSPVSVIATTVAISIHILRVGKGRGHTSAILEVEDTVLLEDRAEHGLDDDARAGVRDERRLLVQLLGEEVDAQVAVLAGRGRSRDADDLAGTALQDQQVADADVVGWDGDGVAGLGGAAWGWTGRARAAYGDVNFFLVLACGLRVVVVVVLVVSAVENTICCLVQTMLDAVDSLVQTVTDGVVVTWAV